MAADIIAQIFADQSHQIVSLIAYIVFRFVLSPAHAHVAIDGIKPLSNCAASLNISFFDHDNLFISAPVAGLISRAATAKSATNDEYIRVHKMSFLTSHELSP